MLKTGSKMIHVFIAPLQLLQVRCIPALYYPKEEKETVYMIEIMQNYGKLLHLLTFEVETLNSVKKSKKGRQH